MSTPPLRMVLMGGNGLDPRTVPGLTAWHDSSDSSTLFTDAGVTSVSADGQAVYQSNDKSGNGNHLVQSTLGLRPLYKAGVFNGRSALLFDNVDDLLPRTTFVGGAIAQPTTHYIVVKLAAVASFQEPMDGSTTRQMIYVNTANWSMYAGSVVAGSTAATTSLTAIGGVFNGAASKLYVNGGAATTLSPGANTMNGVVVGKGADNVPLNGYFCEGLVFAGAHSNTQLDLVGGYLSKRWTATWTAVS